MPDLQPLMPRLPVPDLRVDLAGGGTYDLSAEAPAAFSLVSFYRGFHCPQCRRHLKELAGAMEQFDTLGVSLVAISSDTRERAERAKAEWELPALRIGYDLPLAVARQWGLYVSTGREGATSTGVAEPALFSEPGLFMMRPDRTLYFGQVQTMPFVRPHAADLLAAIEFVIARDYPARGEVAAIPAAPHAA